VSQCGKPECLTCSDGHDSLAAYREFFDVWEAAITPSEERDLTVAAQEATGINYLEVMVDKPNHP
jgi:hypothetical protein